MPHPESGEPEAAARPAPVCFRGGESESGGERKDEGGGEGVRGQADAHVVRSRGNRTCTCTCTTRNGGETEPTNGKLPVQGPQAQAACAAALLATEIEGRRCGGRRRRCHSTSGISARIAPRPRRRRRWRRYLLVSIHSCGESIQYIRTRTYVRTYTPRFSRRSNSSPSPRRGRDANTLAPRRTGTFHLLPSLGKFFFE